MSFSITQSVQPNFGLMGPVSGPSKLPSFRAIVKKDLPFFSNVENTALSTWAGSANLTTLGTIATGVWSGTAIADAKIASAATWNAKQAAITFGTGVQTALGVNTGSAGAPVLFNGALGTPTSGTLTNCTFPTLNQNTSGTAAGLSATLAVTSGGTGLTGITASRLLWSTGANTLGEIALGYGMNVASSELRTPQDLQTSASPTFAGVLINGGSFAQGSVYTHPGIGFTIGCKTGTVNDFSVYNPAGLVPLIFVKTGEDTVRFSGDISCGGNFQVVGKNVFNFNSGNTASFGGLTSGQGITTLNFWNEQAGSATIVGGFSAGTSDFYVNGSLTTGAPSGGTAQPWKLGNYTAGVAVQAGKVRVEINGTPYDLLTA